MRRIEQLRWPEAGIRRRGCSVPVSADEALVGTEVVNTATLAADNLDEPLKDSETVRVAGAGDPVLDKQADKASLAAGDKLSYSVRAIAGVDTTDAVLSDKGLPAGVDIDTETIKVKINGKAANVEIKPEGTGFTIALGKLKADDVVTVTYDATCPRTSTRPPSRTQRP